jgi:hypothetical protein
MSEESSNLHLPYILANQAQKHITHNEAIRRLDAIVQLSVVSRVLAAPPGAPADGARYIVPAGATDAWAGWDNSIAYYADGAWMQLAPNPGWQAYDQNADELLLWKGSAWVVIA